MTQHPQTTGPPPVRPAGHAGGGFTVRQTGSCRFLFHANIHWAYYKISSAGYRVPFAFFQFDFFYTISYFFQLKIMNITSISNM